MQKRKLKHLAIIMDGNRRFAKRLMKEPWKGHEWGAKKIEEVMKWCREFKIKELTLYTFSVDNFNRPKKEFNYLMKLFNKTFQKLIKKIEEINNNGLRIRFIGRLKMFPKSVYDKMKKLMELTKNNRKYFINFAMAYGGKQEIVDAVKLLLDDLKKNKISSDKINENTFKRYLWLSSEPDLVIRTGGEVRTSNFLMWQTAYSEWIFLKKMWPEFSKEDFKQCVEEYYRRERRFGR